MLASSRILRSTKRTTLTSPTSETCNRRCAAIPCTPSGHDAAQSQSSVFVDADRPGSISPGNRIRMAAKKEERKLLHKFVYISWPPKRVKFYCFAGGRGQTKLRIGT